MRWIAKLYSGEIIREDDNVKWDEMDIHLIESLWIDGFENYKISRRNIKNFMEFVQFKTAGMDNRGNFFVESRCIGWSDGKSEFLLRINEKNHKVSMETIKRVHFHPLSYFLCKESSQRNFILIPKVRDG